MEGKRFIRTLGLKNFLSYGTEREEIELQPLNVLIGANTSGKSNLIEAIRLLKATPTDLAAAIRQGGGIRDFLWKGAKDIPIAEIEAILDYPAGHVPLRYQIFFTTVGQRLGLVDEAVADAHSWETPDGYETRLYYHYQKDKSVLNVRLDLVEGTKRRNSYFIPPGTLSSEQSILSQIKDPNHYPELTYLGNYFSRIAIYQKWNIGGNTELRMPQKTDLPEHPILEDGSNLGLFLNNLQSQLGSRQIIEKLQKFYDAAEELTTKISGGTVQIFIRETELIQPIPASRLSDGTLHYLFLLALLLDPTPPPLICIEEPEIGLHPDILPTIAEMLIEASQRTQLIVTTHSDTLVSSLPADSILVCERDYMGSHLRRLDSNRLKKWLDNYSLGELWRMGEIGGNRW